MAMHIERSVDINAPPERVWAVMADVERWPEWTESMKSVERLDSGEFGVGSKAKLHIRRSPDGNVSKVTLTVDLSGIVATLFGPMIAGQSRKNVEMEAEGLKRWCEAAP